MIHPSSPELPWVRAASGPTAGTTLVARLKQSEFFRSYQRAFEDTTGLPLVLREAGSFRTPLEGSPRMNPFCVLMNRANKTCAACLQLQQRVEDEARLEPKTRQCHAGLHETAVPVRIGQRLIGYLQTGQVFLGEAPWKSSQDLSCTLPEGPAGVASPEWKAAYFRTRVIPRKAYAAIIRLLAIFAEHLALISHRLLIMETTTEPPVITKGRWFIAEHHRDELRLDDVARAVHVSAFHFCKIFKKATGYTFTQYLARARVESAKQLMLDANMRVSEAAYASGFQSLSQFNRVFRQIVGEAPGCYRGRLHGLPRPPAIAPAA